MRSYITRPLSRQAVGRCVGMGSTPRPGLDAVVVKQRTFSGQDPRTPRKRYRCDPLDWGRAPLSSASVAGFGVTGQPRTPLEGAAHADDTAAGPQAADAKGLPREGAPHAGVPAETRRVHARLYNDVEEAEF